MKSIFIFQLLDLTDLSQSGSSRRFPSASLNTWNSSVNEISYCTVKSWITWRMTDSTKYPTVHHHPINVVKTLHCTHPSQTMNIPTNRNVPIINRLIHLYVPFDKKYVKILWWQVKQTPFRKQKLSGQSNILIYVERLILLRSCFFFY